MASAEGAPAEGTLYSRCVPDAANTLGGIHGDTEPAHPSVIMHLVKSLVPGQDLTRVTIPPFYLEPRSLLERMSDLLMHPELLLGVSRLPDPLERMRAITRWFLSGWHYKTVGVQKPLNPIVGETFACYWPHADGSRSQYFAEQVLHRPPVSAIYFENRAHDMVANTHVWTKSQFNAPQSVASILDGAVRLTLTNLGEEYWITLPSYYAHNLLMGTLRMEIGDTAHIVCAKTGLRADIEFHQLTMFGSSSRQHSISGAIRRVEAGTGKAGAGPFHPSAKAHDLFTITGHYNSKMFIHRAGEASGPGELFLDVEAVPISPKYVLPLELQGPWESRKLWAHTASELSKRPTVDWDMVDREKAQLEEEQRVLRCHAPAKSAEFEEWATKKFHKRAAAVDPVSGKTVEFFEFDDARLGPYTAGEAEADLIALSRGLPDIRGGLDNLGADPAVVALQRGITLSKRRIADLAAVDAAAAAAKK